MTINLAAALKGAAAAPAPDVSPGDMVDVSVCPEINFFQPIFPPPPSKREHLLVVSVEGPGAIHIMRDAIVEAHWSVDKWLLGPKQPLRVKL